MTLPLLRAAATPIAAGRPGADRAEIDRNVILARRAAAQMRHRKAEAVAAGDDDVPILWHCRIQFLDNRTRVERARGRRIGFWGPGSRRSWRSSRRSRCCASPDG